MPDACQETEPRTSFRSSSRTSRRRKAGTFTSADEAGLSEPVCGHGNLPHAELVPANIFSAADSKLVLVGNCFSGSKHSEMEKPICSGEVVGSHAAYSSNASASPACARASESLVSNPPSCWPEYSITVRQRFASVLTTGPAACLSHAARCNPIWHADEIS